MVLLAGGAGSGKITLATQWLFAGYEQYKIPGVFTSLKESVSRAVSNARKFSFFKEEHLGPMQIYFTDLRRMIKGMEIESEQIYFKQAMEIVYAIVNMIKTSDSKRVVIDSIAA